MTRTLRAQISAGAYLVVGRVVWVIIAPGARSLEGFIVCLDFRASVLLSLRHCRLVKNLDVELNVDLALYLDRKMVAIDVERQPQVVHPRLNTAKEHPGAKLEGPEKVVTERVLVRVRVQLIGHL